MKRSIMAQFAEIVHRIRKERGMDGTLSMLLANKDPYYVRKAAEQVHIIAVDKNPLQPEQIAQLFDWFHTTGIAAKLEENEDERATWESMSFDASVSHANEANAGPWAAECIRRALCTVQVLGSMEAASQLAHAPLHADQSVFVELLNYTRRAMGTLLTNGAADQHASWMRAIEQLEGGVRAVFSPPQ